MADKEYPVARPAGAVILVRERSGADAVEIYLVRRHKGASFMSSASVFPGGTADPGEDDLRVTAARELFEEAGVLFSTRAVDPVTRRTWRDVLNAHEPTPDNLTAVLNLDALHYYAQWITPSNSKKRFSAVFYLGVLPPGEDPVIDNKEAVEGFWVTPEEALSRSRELRLHPPQVRTFVEMQTAANRGIDALVDSAGARAEHPHAIMPRVAPMGASFALLLPWDAEYLSAGTGEALAMPADHPLAVGASRFVFEDHTWKHISAPASPTAD